jgi:pentapeptide repeat protein
MRGNDAPPRRSRPGSALCRFIGWSTCLGALFLIAVWLVPELLVPKSLISDPKGLADVRNGVRDLMIKAVGGLFAAAAAYATWRNLSNTETSVRLATESLAVAQKNQKLAEQGQITERFSKAVECLGSSDLSLKLGGVFALERISRESAPDYWTIMEVLTAYVRHHAAWQEGRPVQRLAPDIQTILTVVGRRAHSYQNGETERLNLSKTDLRKANLAEAKLAGADLNGCHLEEARLWGAQLPEAILTNAHLEGAIFHGLGLEKAELDRLALKSPSGAANLRGAKLNGAHLEETQLQRCDLSHAVLNGAHLKRAYLQDAQLEATQLIEAEDPQEAYLSPDLKQSLEQLVRASAHHPVGEQKGERPQGDDTAALQDEPRAEEGISASNEQVDTDHGPSI